eukprot:16331967-Heterocapsa_arctica.AAC.1
MSTPEGCSPESKDRHLSRTSEHTVGQAPYKVVGTERRKRKLLELSKQQVFRWLQLSAAYHNVRVLD